jgi:uncharacterized membrane protein
VRPLAHRSVRVITITLAVIAYAVLAHFSNAVPGNESLGAFLAMAPLWLAAVILAWRSSRRRLGLFACGLAALLAYAGWDSLKSHFAWLYLIQQAGAYGLLGISFGRSLGHQRVPLCTRFATLVHGPLSVSATRYTRSVTVAWTIFFAAMSSALLLLYVTAPLAAWSVFANFCTAPLVALMFIGEYLVRHRALPDMQHASILDTIRAVSRSAGAASFTVPHA